MSLFSVSGLSLFLFIPVWCVGQASHTDTTRIDNYLRKTIKVVDFPEWVTDQVEETLTEAEYSVVQLYDTASQQIPSFEAYFGAALAACKTAEDSMLTIVRKGYGVSNYGWALSDNPRLITYSVKDQYRLMAEGRYDGLCGDFSNFIENVFEFYGFPAVTARVQIDGANGHYEGHIFVLVRSKGDWYLLETTTGQMLLDSEDGSFLTYAELLERMVSEDLDGIVGTEPVYGRFIQPTALYLSKDFKWLYGTDPVSILRQSDGLTTLSVKRSLELWENSFAVQGIYIRYLTESGRGADWFYVYDTEYIQAVYGSPVSIALFHDDGLCSITEMAKVREDNEDMFSVDLNSEMLTVNTEVMVFSSSGELMLITDNEGEFDLSDLSPGLYICVGQGETERFVISN